MQGGVDRLPDVGVRALRGAAARPRRSGPLRLRSPRRARRSALRPTIAFLLDGVLFLAAQMSPSRDPNKNLMPVTDFGELLTRWHLRDMPQIFPFVNTC